ncbi:MAG: hypothetical protein HY315_05055 [Acidobacteria bacterium]|nr:hypothetical protein [Acidobacteriota bacterium]
MKNAIGWFRSLFLSCLLLASFAIALPMAQGQCAMCRANLSAVTRGMRSMNAGILMLLVPTVAILGGIGLVVYRRRD